MKNLDFLFLILAISSITYFIYQNMSLNYDTYIDDFYLKQQIGTDPNGFFYSPYTKGPLYFITTKISVILTLIIMLIAWYYILEKLLVKSGPSSILVLLFGTGGFSIVDPVILTSAILLLGYSTSYKFKSLFLAASTFSHLSGLFTIFKIIKTKLDFILFFASLTVFQLFFDLFGWTIRSFKHYLKFTSELPIHAYTIYLNALTSFIGFLPIALLALKRKDLVVFVLMICGIIFQSFGIFPEMMRYSTPLICLFLYETQEKEVRPYAVSTILLYIFIKLIMKV